MTLPTPAWLRTARSRSLFPFIPAVAIAVAAVDAAAQLPDDVHWFYEYGGPSPEPFVMAVSGHHIYAGGLFLNVEGDTDKKNFTRFNLLTETWERVPGVDDGFNGGVWAIHNGDDGALYLGGNFTRVLGTTANGVASFDPTTNTWAPLFDPSPDLVTTGQESGPTNGRVFATLKVGNFLYVGGEFTGPVGSPNDEKYIRRYRLDTNRWERVGGGLDDQVRALALAPNGDVIAGGGFTGGLARWNGSNWSVISGGLGGGFAGSPIVRALAVAQDGTIYLGGDFDTVGAATTPMAVRDVAAVSPAGVWDTLAGGFDDEYRQSNGTTFDSDGVYDLALDLGGTLYAGGDFDASNGRAVLDLRHIAMWDGTGAWKPLGSGVGTTGSQIVNAVAVGPDGSVYAGGVFNIGWGTLGAPNKAFARWHPGQDFTGYVPGAAENTTVSIAAVDATTRAVTLQTRPGTTYVFDAADGLGGWVEIPGSELVGNGNIQGFNLTSESPARNYRVRATDY